MITFPLMMIPVGMRESTPAGVLVGRAYADAYPYSDQEDVKVEDWAISLNNQEEYLDPAFDPDNPDKPSEPFTITFEPLIDEETFNATLKKRHKNKTYKSPYWFHN